MLDQPEPSSGPAAAGRAQPDRDEDEPTGGSLRAGFGLKKMVLLAFSIALFAIILWLGGVESWQTVLSGDPRYYFAVFVLSGVGPGLSAWRLRTLVRTATGRDVGGFRRFFHINMTAIALGLFLPRNAALLGGKAAYLRTLGVPLLRGTWAVLMENVVDLVFLLMIVLPCGLVLLGGLGGRAFIAATTACLVLLLTGVLVMRGRDWRGFVGAVVRRVPFVAARLPAPEGGFVPGPLRALPMVAVTLLIHVSLMVRAYLVALAIGLDVPLVVIAAAYPLTQLGLALAVAPGALGTLDASWLGLLILADVPNSEAFAFTVALRACIVVFPMIWYGVSALISLSMPASDGAKNRGSPAYGDDDPHPQDRPAGAER